MRKLRTKFILISALSIFSVLFIVVLVFNITNVVQNTQRADSTINRINEKGGDAFETIGDPVINPEDKFRNRFFIARYEGNTLVSLDTAMVSRISEDEAREIANEVYTSYEKSGFTNSYRYIKFIEDESTKIIFLDQQREIEMTNNALLISSLAGVGGFVVMLFPIVLFSKIVFKATEEADKKQKRFITDSSHEFKTPLTIINSNIEIIEMENGVNEWTTSTREQVDRLTKMTNELVVLSKLNERDMKIEFNNVDLSKLVSELSKTYESLLANNNVTLSLDVDENIALSLNETLITQTITSLLDNMFKYAAPGEAKVSLKNNKKKVVLELSNKVIDASKIDTKSLFDRFYRTDASRNSKVSGFGIGLSMVKEAVEIQHGKVTAELVDDCIIFKIVL